MEKSSQATRTFSFRRKDKNKEKEREQKELDNGFDFEHMSYLSQTDAHQLYEELLTEFSFSVEQLTELTGLSSAVAVSKVYRKETLTKKGGALLVVCGPGRNGACGLTIARHLKMFGYKPTVYYPIRSNKQLYQNLATQCEKVDIPFLYYLPSETALMTDSYNLIIDAVFGSNFVPPVREEFAQIIQHLVKCDVPVISIDVPSGWHVETGDPDGLQPEMLISLTVPKQCARMFKGKYHYLCGRYLPPDLAKKYELYLPPFPGSEQCVEIRTTAKETRETTSSEGSSNIDGEKTGR